MFGTDVLPARIGGPAIVLRGRHTGQELRPRVALLLRDYLRPSPTTVRCMAEPYDIEIICVNPSTG